PVLCKDWQCQHDNNENRTKASHVFFLSISSSDFHLRSSFKPRGHNRTKLRRIRTKVFAVAHTLSLRDALSANRRRFTHHEELHDRSIRHCSVTSWRVGIRRSSLHWGQNWSTSATASGLRGPSTAYSRVRVDRRLLVCG